MPAAIIHFSSAPTPHAETTVSSWRSIEKRGFCVLIRRLYAGQELVVGSVEWLAKPVYARQDWVVAAHNGTMEAPRDSPSLEYALLA
jgi:hypothetical protein